MSTAIDLQPFVITTPEKDPNLERYFIKPSIFAELLNAESTLLAANVGHGKSTVLYYAQKALEQDWLNVNMLLTGSGTGTTSEASSYVTPILREITSALWELLQSDPSLVGKLGVRKTAAKYFLTHYLGENAKYLLECLAEDAPAHADEIQQLIDLQPPDDFFTAMSTEMQKLSTLCDCIQKLGKKGAMIWIDLSPEVSHLEQPMLYLLHDFFDSLPLTRRSTLHIKCAADPTVCQQLKELRGSKTLTVKSIGMDWSVNDLHKLIDSRLQFASRERFNTFDQLVKRDQLEQFLAETSDLYSPIEWLTLGQLVIKTHNTSSNTPLSEVDWLATRRAYFAEWIKLRMDDEGRFWRGKHLLADLTPRKSAIYPLIEFLYEHPGFHKASWLFTRFGFDDNTLNTTISRARKYLEPLADHPSSNQDSWIYLVTDPRGGGYGLVNTVRSA